MSKTRSIADNEVLEIVDKNGSVLGTARRSDFHGNPSLIHRVVHVLVFDRKGRLLLQKRSLNKDVAPGKWDTSVGGHVNPGEDVLTAAIREMREELGIKKCVPEYLYSYLFSNHVESELVSTFSCVYSSKILFNKEEIEETAFWDMKEIRKNLGKKVFSGHFEKEILTFFTKSALSDHPLAGMKDIFMDLDVQPDAQSVIENP
ncbi:MAG: NUDIX domain-containing protein [Nitrospirota bacterium]|nr:NUDIX domain-containing protein [Nitrospirota bacterium]